MSKLDNLDDFESLLFKELCDILEVYNVNAHAAKVLLVDYISMVIHDRASQIIFEALSDGVFELDSKRNLRLAEKNS